MSYIRMCAALLATVWLILFINRKKDRIVPVCVLYYLTKVLLDTFSITGVLEFANGFGFSYQLTDLAIFIFGGLILLDVINKPTVKENIINRFVFLLVLLCMISMFNGISAFGVNAEVIGDIRTVFSFMLGVICFARIFKVEYIREHAIFIHNSMTFVLVFTIIIWGLDIAFGFHPLYSQYNAMLSDGGSTMRFIQPAEVLAIALYTLYLCQRDLMQYKCFKIRSIIFVLVTILFQHRTIWGALIAGLGIIIVRAFWINRPSKKLIGQIFCIIIIATAIIFVGNGSIAANIKNSAEVILNIFTGGSLENTTANTRVNVWNAVLDDLHGVSKLVGRPFGYGYGRTIGWNTSPHSGYIRLIGRTGFLGIFALLMLSLFSIVKAAKKGIPFIPEFLFAILAYMYGYDFNWMIGVIFGAVLIILANEKEYTQLKIGELVD